MKTINVASAFELVLGAGRTIKVPAGVQNVDDEVADHWFTALHLASGGFGTAEYAASTRQTADTAFLDAKAAVDRYEGLEKAARAAEEAAGLKPTAPAYERLGGFSRDEEEDRMVEIEVATAFEVQIRPDQPPQHFDVGTHEVSDEVAQHPVVLAHLVGNDTGNAGDGADTLEPGAGSDTLSGTEGADTLDGAGAGNDGEPTLSGSEGADTLQSAGGDATLPGGGAADDELDPALIDAMTDEELRAFITKAEGKAPHHMLGHAKLLAQAKAIAAKAPPKA